MNKLRVIDLLNKIANGEEVPKRVLYNEETYSYVERNRLFAKYIKEPFNARIPYYLFTDVKNIYDEVEIIEEDKKIEKLETYKEIDDEEHYANILKVSKNGEYEINEALSVVVDKINEIIDYINKEDK